MANLLSLEMERLENAAKVWLEKQQSTHTCSVEIQNGVLFFTVQCVATASDTKNVSFTINHDEEEDTWTVMSEHPEILPRLEQIFEYCDSSKQKNIELLLDKMFKIVNEVTKQTLDKEEEEDDDDDVHVEEAALQSDTVNDGNASGSDDEDSRFFGNGANVTVTAQHRLMKDRKSMKRDAQKFGIEANLRGDNLFLWDVKLTNFPTDTQLGKDIADWAQSSNREPVIYLEMHFPGDYPMKPPFVRVIRPRIKIFSGHVTAEGSFCMQMLTCSGWIPTNDIESILVQIRSEIMSDPNTRLDSDPDLAYDEDKARKAFDRMVTSYEWN